MWSSEVVCISGCITTPQFSGWWRRDARGNDYSLHARRRRWMTSPTTASTTWTSCSTRPRPHSLPHRLLPRSPLSFLFTSAFTVLCCLYCLYRSTSMWCTSPGPGTSCASCHRAEVWYLLHCDCLYYLLILDGLDGNWFSLLWYVASWKKIMEKHLQQWVLSKLPHRCVCLHSIFQIGVLCSKLFCCLQF
jgi:hypothetical protein